MRWWIHEVDSDADTRKCCAFGANRDYVREGYRVLFVNRHAIYYIVSPSGIRVVRVFHEENRIRANQSAKGIRLVDKSCSLTLAQHFR